MGEVSVVVRPPHIVAAAMALAFSRVSYGAELVWLHRFLRLKLASMDPSALRYALPCSFFARSAEQVAVELVGCLLVRRCDDGSCRWGVVVETEAYCQSDPACHGHRRRSPRNETLFGEPARFYVYISYGIHHCCNVVTHRRDWASGVLLRAIDLPVPPGRERLAAGPGLLCRHFAITRAFDGQPATSADAPLWIAPRPPSLAGQICSGRLPVHQHVRIGVSKGQEIPWRWYLAASRCVSRRAKGDRLPPPGLRWSSQQLLEPFVS